MRSEAHIRPGWRRGHGRSAASGPALRAGCCRPSWLRAFFEVMLRGRGKGGKSTEGRTQARPSASISCVGFASESVGADGGGDRVELRRGVVTEEGDGGDADDRDQGNEEGVLDQRGATLVIETGPKPVGEELDRGDHFLACSLWKVVVVVVTTIPGFPGAGFLSNELSASQG